MKPFYATRERQARLIAEATAWLGTPFAAHACIRGAGVDCVHLWAALYVATGAMERFNPPKYKLDGGQHSTQSLIVEYVESCGRFQKLERGASMLPGDLLPFKITGAAWHVGGFIGGINDRFIHCQIGAGVIESSLTERKWARRLVCIYRPIEVTP